MKSLQIIQLLTFQGNSEWQYEMNGIEENLDFNYFNVVSPLGYT